MFGSAISYAGALSSNPRQTISQTAQGVGAMYNSYSQLSPFQQGFIAGNIVGAAATSYAIGNVLMSPMSSTAVANSTVTYVGKGSVSVPEGSSIRFAQTSVSANFSEAGSMAGASRVSVIEGLKNGSIKPSDLPIKYIDQGGYKLVENTRSASTLIQAGIPENMWTLIKDTSLTEKLNIRLMKNGLDSIGTDILNVSY
jgi:hypothetical protein